MSDLIEKLANELEELDQWIIEKIEDGDTHLCKQLSLVRANCAAEFILKLLIDDKNKANGSMMLAASREDYMTFENGGVEVAPFVIFRSMIKNFAESNGIEL